MRTIRRRRSRAIIASIGGFQADWYLAQYPDVALRGVHPLVHYVAYGAAEGRDPNPWFDTDWYLAQYPDVAGSALNPLAHYLKYGAAEGRNPGPHFDTGRYLATNPDVAKSGVNPLAHYLDYGAAEARAPAPRRLERKRERRAVRPELRRGRAGEHRMEGALAAPAAARHAIRPQRPPRVLRGQPPEHSGWRELRRAPGRRRHRAGALSAILRVRSLSRRGRRRAAAQDARRLRLDGGRLRHRGCDDPVHLASWTALALALRERWRWTIVYDCMDEWDGFPGIGADVLAAEARARARRRRRDGHRRRAAAKNGARRRAAARSCATASTLRSSATIAVPNERSRVPRAGGRILRRDRRHGSTRSRRRARQRAPEWQFVLAGDVFVSDVRGLDSARQRQAARPAAVRRDARAALAFRRLPDPVRVNAITARDRSGEALRVPERRQAGGVGRRCRKSQVHGDVICLRDGADGFLAAAIAAALAERRSAARAARRALARAQQWSERFGRRIDALIRARYPTVSIVIVTYNNRELTRLCLESILARPVPGLRDHRRRQHFHRRHARRPARARGAPRRHRGHAQRREPRVRGGEQPGPRASRAATCWCCSTTTRWCRAAGCAGCCAASTIPRSGSPAR